MWHFEALLGAGNLRYRECSCIDLENIAGGVAFDYNTLFIHRGRETMGNTEIRGKFAVWAQPLDELRVFAIREVENGHKAIIGL
jgi:hypothetical protein